MRKKSILIVDDEESIRHSFYKDFTQESYDVMTAKSGEEAIQQLHSKSYDLIVVDLVMPGVNGISVLKEAKIVHPDVCVFILTAYGDMNSAIEALRLGADDYLLKPCDSEVLLLRVTRHLEKQQCAQKARIYENILPVCSYCKDIRDDSGKAPGMGKWMKMEDYLNLKCGTDISHGCCPKCLEKYKYNFSVK